MLSRILWNCVMVMNYDVNVIEIYFSFIVFFLVTEYTPTEDEEFKHLWLEKYAMENGYNVRTLLLTFHVTVLYELFGADHTAR